MSRLVWAAAKDGVAHASRPGFARTLCHAKTQDPRWAWPEQSRCGECLALDVWPTVRRLTTQAPTASGAVPFSASRPGVALSSPGRGVPSSKEIQR